MSPIAQLKPLAAVFLLNPGADTPLKQSYSLEERPGCLRLYGNCYDLSSPESPTMLLRKQTAYAQSFEATMAFEPSKAGYEAGIVLWWNQFSYATIGVALVKLADGEEVQTVVRRSPTGQAGIMNVSHVRPRFSVPRPRPRPRPLPRPRPSEVCIG